MRSEVTILCTLVASLSALLSFVYLTLFIIHRYASSKPQSSSLSLKKPKFNPYANNNNNSNNNNNNATPSASSRLQQARNPRAAVSGKRETFAMKKLVGAKPPVKAEVKSVFAMKKLVGANPPPVKAEVKSVWGENSVQSMPTEVKNETSSPAETSAPAPAPGE